MTEPQPPTLITCADCGVDPGQPHVDGCDVARCTVCGWQRISCDHSSSGDGWGAVWTGMWPGEVECYVLGLLITAPADPWSRWGDPDLNRLASLQASGQLVWDGRHQLWVRPRL